MNANTCRRNCYRNGTETIPSVCHRQGLRGVCILLLAAALGSVAVFSGRPALAQQEPLKLKPPVDQVLRAKDGFPIAITYYESPLGQEAPAVILLHMKGENRLVWKDGLAEKLQQEGFAVVAVDLRRHGDSKRNAGAVGTANRNRRTRLTVRDHKAMVLYDLEAVKSFLMKQHHAKKLNVRKTAIVAPEFSAPIAVEFTRRDWLKEPYDDAPTAAARTPRGQDIRALVLMSPKESVRGVIPGRSWIDVAKPRWGIHFLVMYGTQDVVDRGRDAQSIRRKLLTGNRKSKKQVRVYEAKYNTKLRGTDMLDRVPKIETHFMGFLKKHVKDLPGQWVDRRSRLER